MGFTLRFFLGFVLVLTTCTSLGLTSPWDYRYKRQSNSTTSTPILSSTIAEEHDEESQINRTDNNQERNKNAAERKPKTETWNSNSVLGSGGKSNEHEHPDADPFTTERNVRTKLKKSEPYSTRHFHAKEGEDEHSNYQSESENSKEQDAKQYYSPEFQSKNNVYTIDLSSDGDKYTHDFEKDSTYDDEEYTQSYGPTPEYSESKHYFDFDAHESSIGDYNTRTTENDFPESKERYLTSSDKFMDMDKTNGTDKKIDIDFLTIKKIEMNDKKNGNSIRKNVVTQKRTSIVTSFTKTELTDEKDDDPETRNNDEDEEDTSEPVRDDAEADDTVADFPTINQTATTEKGHALYDTTKKNTVLTKPPPLVSNVSHISLLNNKIEADVLKSIETTTVVSTIKSNSAERVTAANNIITNSITTENPIFGQKIIPADTNSKVTSQTTTVKTTKLRKMPAGDVATKIMPLSEKATLKSTIFAPPTVATTTKQIFTTPVPKLIHTSTIKLLPKTTTTTESPLITTADKTFPTTSTEKTSVRPSGEKEKVDNFITNGAPITVSKRGSSRFNTTTEPTRYRSTYVSRRISDNAKNNDNLVPGNTTRANATGDALVQENKNVFNIQVAPSEIDDDETELTTTEANNGTASTDTSEVFSDNSTVIDNTESTTNNSITVDNTDTNKTTPIIPVYIEHENITNAPDTVVIFTEEYSTSSPENIPDYTSVTDNGRFADRNMEVNETVTTHTLSETDSPVTNLTHSVNATELESQPRELDNSTATESEPDFIITTEIELNVYSDSINTSAETYTNKPATTDIKGNVIEKEQEQRASSSTTTEEPFVEYEEEDEDEFEKKPHPELNSTESVELDVEHTSSLPELLTPHKSNREPEIRIFNDATEPTLLPAETTTNFELQRPQDEDNKGTIAAIVISCVAAVCLIVLAVLLILMRKRQKRFNNRQRCTPVSLDSYSMDNVSVYNSVRRKGMRSSKRSFGNPAFDDPTSITHPLTYPALAKFATNFEDIKSEFEEIPQITARMTELPDGCDVKNRYANVIPLPETRVVLSPIEGIPTSDYINANYVTGPKGSRGHYIACQAPMQNTVEDFWRMVWEQESKVILMLTHLFENGVEKSVDYLPPSEVTDCHRLFGDFQITLKKREVKDKYIISNLQLKNMVSNSWREITHFWYMGWPEKGVPSEGNSLIAFLIEARSCMKSPASENNNKINGNHGNLKNQEVNPIVIHCSPGTGRTGTVIACDIAIREFELSRQVDIPRIVYRIRRDRASSVQTKDQYTFIYKVISLYATKLTGGALDSL